VETTDVCDVAIVGAGAAGLAAAIVASECARGETGHSIVLLDGANCIGAKILVSGGGRCNITHDTVTPNDYFGNRRIIKNVLAAFSAGDTVEWFTSMGVTLKREDTGKLFPVTDTAKTVLTALVTRCRSLGISIRTGHRVTRLEQSADAGFDLQHNHGALQAKNVILATGGRSIPKSGSDGFGYSLARRLGHSVTTTVPALVPLVLDDRMFHRSLSGLSLEVTLTTTINGKTVDTRTGSLLWTHFGISGPVVMDASRFWTLAQARGEDALVHANFLPGQTQEQIRAWFVREASYRPRRSLVNALAWHIPERMAEALCQHVGGSPKQALAQVCRADRERLIAALTTLPLPIERDRGWNYAEVTAGGVPLEEIDYRTMESKLVSGLYLIGEMLDCDGRIGGFNFQWAWATGFLAGRAVAGR
jgi:predicted Rossmann fold flavoprotein